MLNLTQITVKITTDISTDVGFFIAPNYILTTYGTIMYSEEGIYVSNDYMNTNAILVDYDKELNIALLYVETNISNLTIQYTFPKKDEIYKATGYICDKLWTVEGTLQKHEYDANLKKLDVVKGNRISYKGLCGTPLILNETLIGLLQTQIVGREIAVITTDLIIPFLEKNNINLQLK